MRTNRIISTHLKILFVSNFKCHFFVIPMFTFTRLVLRHCCIEYIIISLIYLFSLSCFYALHLLHHGVGAWSVYDWRKIIWLIRRTFSDGGGAAVFRRRLWRGWFQKFPGSDIPGPPIIGTPPRKREGRLRRWQNAAYATDSLRCFWINLITLQLQLQLQSYTLQRIVLRGIMQCYRLVGKDGFSALIGTVGDC